jgi:hypothetical protein
MSRTYKDRFELRGETNVADPDPGSEIRCILDPWIPDIPDPRSAILGEINLFQFVMINWSIGHSIFNFKTTLSPDEHTTIFHFLIINSRSQISDPDFYPSRIPVSDTRSRIQQ